MNILKAGFLLDDTILQTPHLELADIADDRGRYEGGTDGAGLVEALGVAPLGLGELAGSAGYVVCGGAGEVSVGGG